MSAEINTDGDALCWGQNNRGQLDDGTLTTTGTPQFVTGGDAFTQLGGGVWINCGVRTDGAGLCWGRNNRGQLGDGTFTEGASYVT